MDKNTLRRSRAFVRSRLLPHLRSRHEEDCAQYVAMRLWEKEQQGYPKFDKMKLLVDYIREHMLEADRVTLNAIELGMEHPIDLEKFIVPKKECKKMSKYDEDFQLAGTINPYMFFTLMKHIGRCLEKHQKVDETYKLADGTLKVRVTFTKKSRMR